MIVLLLPLPLPLLLLLLLLLKLLLQVASMFASIVSGTFIGLGFAVLLTYQQVLLCQPALACCRNARTQGLFTELPFVFLFPTGLYRPTPTLHPLRSYPPQLLLRYRHEHRRQRAGRSGARACHHVPHDIRHAQGLTAPAQPAKQLCALFSLQYFEINVNRDILISEQTSQRQQHKSSSDETTGGQKRSQLESWEKTGGRAA